jgi:transcriptional regulator with XRE-family HTH domain
MGIANRVRAALEERRLSQVDLAELTGVPYTTIRRLVQPESNPFLDDVLRVARVLEIPVARLFWLARGA